VRTLNNACRHRIDVSGYPDDIEIPSWRAKYSKCGGKRVDVRPNWKERWDLPVKRQFNRRIAVTVAQP
jgi:hypothetical protein